MNEKSSVHPDPRVRSRSIRERAELLDTAFCYALEEAAGMASPADALAWAQVAATIIDKAEGGP